MCKTILLAQQGLVCCKAMQADHGCVKAISSFRGCKAQLKIVCFDVSHQQDAGETYVSAWCKPSFKN